MKKLISILLCAMILLSFAGCNNTKKPAEFDESLVIGRATSYVESLIKYDYDNIYVNLNSEASKTLTTDVIEEAWMATIPYYETAPTIVSSNYVSSIDTATATITIAIDTQAFDVVFAFDSDMKISGLWIREGIMPSGGTVETIENDILKEHLVSVGATDSKMNGILTVPKNVENPPVVLLIQGSGSSNMNEEIGANKPFMDIAHGLAANGIASLRYDKRYYAFISLLQSDLPTLTVYDEVIDDAMAAIELLKGEEMVDSNRIYLLGHSLGGMLAPKIATDSKDIKGIISLAGTTRKIQELILDQNTEALAAMDNLTQEEKDEQLEAVKAELEKIDAIDEPTSDLIFGYPQTYWKSMNDIDTASLAQQLDIPFLILQGSADFQVYPDVDFELWKTTLGERSNVTYKLYEGLNHLFMETNGLRTSAEYDTAGTVSQEVIDDISNFIKQ